MAILELGVMDRFRSSPRKRFTLSMTSMLGNWNPNALDSRISSKFVLNQIIGEGAWMMRAMPLIAVVAF